MKDTEGSPLWDTVVNHLLSWYNSGSELFQSMIDYVTVSWTTVECGSVGTSNYVCLAPLVLPLCIEVKWVQSYRPQLQLTLLSLSSPSDLTGAAWDLYSDIITVTRPACHASLRPQLSRPQLCCFYMNCNQWASRSSARTTPPSPAYHYTWLYISWFSRSFTPFLRLDILSQDLQGNSLSSGEAVAETILIKKCD